MFALSACSNDAIASKMYRELFNARNFGRASTIAVALLVAVAPFTWLNIRRIREGGPGE